MFPVASTTVAPFSTLFPIRTEDKQVGVFLEYRRPGLEDAEIEVIDAMKVGKDYGGAVALQDPELREHVRTGE